MEVFISSDTGVENRRRLYRGLPTHEPYPHDPENQGALEQPLQPEKRSSNNVSFSSSNEDLSPGFEVKIG